MKDKRRKIKNSKRGMVLVLAVIIVLILALIGIGLLQLGKNARLQAVKDVLQESAHSAADAGIEDAVRYMIKSWKIAPNKNTWVYTTWYDPTVWTNPAVPATPVNYSSASVSLGGTFGNERFTYNIYKGTKQKGYQIISTGTAAAVTRKVHSAVVLRPTFFGIGAKDNININVGGNLGTVPVGDTLLVQTNSITAPPSGGIMLRQGLNVPGDVICGPGGDTDVAVIEKKNVVIQGDTAAAEDYIDFTSIPPQSLPAGSWTVDPNDPTKASITSSMTFSSLTVGSPSTVTTLKIIGDIDVYVTGPVVLSSGATLMVTDNSKLELYLGNSIGAKNGSNITYEGMPPNPDPVTNEALIIKAALAISLKGTDTCTSVKLYNSGNFYGAVYAPEATVEIGNTAGFYGATCGKNIIIKNSGVYMYVPALYDTNDVEVLYPGVKQGSWWEE